MSTGTKIILAVALIAGMSSAAMAQKTESGNPLAVSAGSPVLTLVASHPSARRAHGRVRHSRDVRLNGYAPAQDLPPVSVVGPDNYQYWREACCF